MPQLPFQSLLAVRILPKAPKYTYKHTREAKEITIAKVLPLHSFYLCSQLI